MENPAKQTVRAILFVILGIFIGFIPGLIRMDQMRQDAESAAAFNARSMAQLKDDMHDEQMYYMKQMAIYRHQLGLRLSAPTPTDVASGTTCAEEFGVMGQAGGGVRSWKPRADGRCYAEDAQ
jgi:hypothetical protein